MAISAVGSIIGSFLIVAIAPTKRFRFMSICAVVVVCALFGMSRSVNFIVTASSMCLLAVALSTNFGLAGTIVQERAPSPLRGRISAIFGMSFFGLQPVAGLLTPGFADLVGIRTALMVSSIIFGIGALFVLMRLAGHQCDAQPGSTSPAPEPARHPGFSCLTSDCLFDLLEFRPSHRRRRNVARDQRRTRLQSHRARARHSHFAHARNSENVRSGRSHFQQPAQLLSAAGGSHAGLARLLQIFRRHIARTRTRRETNAADD